MSCRSSMNAVADANPQPIERQSLVICGLGQGSSTLLAFAAKLNKYKLAVFSSYKLEDGRYEVENFQQVLKERGQLVALDRGNDQPENPVKYVVPKEDVTVSHDAAEVIPDADVILMPVPGFAILGVLNEVAPYLKKGAIVYVLPGQGGMPFLTRQVRALKRKMDAREVIVAAAIPMPVNARWAPGKQYEELAVTALKSNYWVSADPPGLANAQLVADVLAEVLDVKNEVNPRGYPYIEIAHKKRTLPGTVLPVAHPLGILLNASNPNLHPGRLYKLFKNFKPDYEHKGFLAKFYDEWDDESSMYMHKISLDRHNIWKALCETEQGKALGLSVDQVPDILTYLEKIYAGQIEPAETAEGKSLEAKSLTELQANERDYVARLTHVVKNNLGFRNLRWEEDNGGYMKAGSNGGYLVDTTMVFFTEDIPQGTAVYKCIADILGVETPFLDQLLTWVQTFMGKDYIRIGADGKVTPGDDFHMTKCPQNFGMNTVESLFALEPAQSSISVTAVEATEVLTSSGGECEAKRRKI